MKTTSEEYDSVIAICRSLFVNKMNDYGSAWRILRLPSLTDQIFIKAQRIRSLQQNEVRKINEDEILIQEEDGNFTQEYIDLTCDYYIQFKQSASAFQQS